MNEKSFAAMAAGLPILLLPACQKGPAQPNIIFFLVDDFGWMDTQVPFASMVEGVDVSLGEIRAYPCWCAGRGKSPPAPESTRP